MTGCHPDIEYQVELEQRSIFVEWHSVRLSTSCFVRFDVIYFILLFVKVIFVDS